MGARRRPRLAVWKLASCDGCQLSLLDCEDELLAVAGAVDVAYFVEATSRAGRGPYDLSLVEGSIATPHDAARIQEVRRASKRLVTIGACATAGGIQALRNLADVKEMARAVYATPDVVEALARSTPVSDHVAVDFELRGCPISKAQLLETVAAFLQGRRPALPTHAVCLDCKLAGHSCVLVAGGLPCLGPVTQTGCGALCPGFARGCYGCFGPREAANTASLAGALIRRGASAAEIGRAFRTFNAEAPAFRREADAHGG